MYDSSVCNPTFVPGYLVTYYPTTTIIVPFDTATLDRINRLENDLRDARHRLGSLEQEVINVKADRAKMKEAAKHSLDKVREVIADLDRSVA